jgi:heat shock protein HslJ
MRTSTLLPGALLCALTLLLAACGEAAGPGAEGEPAEPPDGAWVLVDGTGPDGAVLVVDALRPTLTVDGQDWGGQICNSYGATVEVDGDRLEVQDLMSTEMACLDDGAMESEAAYLDAFRLVDRFERDGGALVLTGADVELRFDAQDVAEDDAAFEGTTWRLESIAEGQDADAAVSSVVGDAFVAFDGEELTGHNGCNQFAGAYELEGDQLVVEDLGQTLIGCDGPEGEQEAVVMAVLESGPTVRHDGMTLELTTPDGQALVFRAG